MNSIAFVLRRSSAINRTRSVILATLRSTRIDGALLCSGFFQSDSKFCAGTDLDIMSARGGAALSLTTVGHYGYRWKLEYIRFFNALQAKNSAAGFSAVQLRVPGFRWHAKVFIAKHQHVPVLAVIGSSNMTRPAFGITSPFNRECDVIVWDESEPLVHKLVTEAISDPLDPSDVIVARVVDEHPTTGQGTRNKISNLEEEILASAVSF